MRDTSLARKIYGVTDKDIRQQLLSGTLIGLLLIPILFTSLAGGALQSWHIK